MAVNISSFVVRRAQAIEAAKAASKSVLDSGTCPTCGQRAPTGSKAKLRADKKWLRKRRAVERAAREVDFEGGSGI